MALLLATKLDLLPRAIINKKGFLLSHSDSSLFVKTTSTSITIILVYVDDILLTGNDSILINALLIQMHKVFSIKELGLISHFLGISVQSHSHGFFLSHQKYAGELLLKASIVDYQPSSTPMALKPPSGTADDLPFSQLSFYRSVVGGL
ncbi:uncharacterized protein LOC114257807 [Camellia sinensis]|uniref:uncharacterized protein LOC114257807 n=1 Tax=Camellia sinensis TaxID=4442 RepID=UPI0010360672|nr:uncharacterized protein LOC114257807 [Camellia sinensis]